MKYLSVFLCLVLFIPLFADWSIIGDLTHYSVMNNGEQVTKSIIISNHASEKLVLSVTQADYAYNSEDNIWFVEAGKLERSNAKWISFATQELTIAPKSQDSFSYTISVPGNEELIGSYWSIIFIEESNISYKKAKDNELNLQVNQRYAIQTITQIADTGSYDIQFKGAELIKSTTVLQLSLKNTGERWVNPSVWVEVYEADGDKLGVFYADKYKLYPQTSYVYKIQLASLNKSNYYVVAVVDCGENKIFGSQFNIQN